VLTDQPDRVAGMPFAHWNAATAGGAEAEPSTADGDDIAVLLYTSGTSGRPRATMPVWKRMAMLDSASLA